MFDIGFSELLLVLVIGLIVLGPERLPVAVKTVMGWIRVMRTLATNVQQELSQELKLQEFQANLKNLEEASKDAISPKLQTSIDELRKTVDELQHPHLYQQNIDLEKAEDEAQAHTMTNSTPSTATNPLVVPIEPMPDGPVSLHTVHPARHDTTDVNNKAAPKEPQ